LAKLLHLLFGDLSSAGNDFAEAHPFVVIVDPHDELAIGCPHEEMGGVRSDVGSGENAGHRESIDDWSLLAVRGRQPSMRYPRLDKAIGLAAQLHQGQEREGDAPLPYVTHPMEVLMALRYEGGETDEDLLCAAALHDVIEESGASLDELRSVVGERAAGLVKELTRQEPSKEETQGMSKDEIWKLRANMLLDEIREMSPEAQRVKLADRVANLREAKRTKAGPKWERYAWQTEEILNIVPRERCPGLWDAIKRELAV
jgi:hypothetical protein